MEKDKFKRAKEIEKLSSEIIDQMEAIDRILKGYNHEIENQQTVSWFNKSDENSYQVRIYNASSYKDVALSKSTIETALFLQRSKLLNSKEALSREFNNL